MAAEFHDDGVRDTNRTHSNAPWKWVASMGQFLQSPILREKENRFLALQSAQEELSEPESFSPIPLEYIFTDVRNGIPLVHRPTHRRTFSSENTFNVLPIIEDVVDATNSIPWNVYRVVNSNNLHFRLAYVDTTHEQIWVYDKKSFMGILTYNYDNNSYLLDGHVLPDFPLSIWHYIVLMKTCKQRDYVYTVYSKDGKMFECYFDLYVPLVPMSGEDSISLKKKQKKLNQSQRKAKGKKFGRFCKEPIQTRFSVHSYYGKMLSDLRATQEAGSKRETPQELIVAGMQEGFTRSEIKNDYNTYVLHAGNDNYSQFRPQFTNQSKTTSTFDASDLFGDINFTTEYDLPVERILKKLHEYCVSLEKFSPFSLMGERMLKILEATALCISSLMITTSNALPVLLQYASSCCEESLTTTMKKLLKGLFSPTEQYGLSDAFSKVAHHPLFNRFTVLASAVVAIGFVPPAMLTINGFKLFKDNFVKSYTDPIDMVDSVLGALEFFCTTGWECFTKCSVRPFWDAQSEDCTFENDYHHLRAYLSALKDGSYEPRTNKSMAEYQEKLINCVTFADKMVRTARVGSPIRNRFSDKLMELRRIESEYDNVAKSSGFRIAPYAIKIHGPSGVGKTSLAQILMKAVLLHNGYDASDAFTNTWSPTDKFMATHKSKTVCLLIDDMCNSPPSVSNVNPGELLIQCVGNVYTFAPQAEAELKGKVSLEPKLVVITTNNERLDADTYSVEPASILRRCKLHLTVKLKKAFADSNGMLLPAEVKKAFPRRGQIQDIWDITVRDFHSAPSKTHGAHATADFRDHNFGTDDKPKTVIDIFDLLRFVYIESKKHYAAQKELVTDNTDFDKHIEVCPKCKKVTQLCDCVLDNQSGFDPESVFTMFWNGNIIPAIYPAAKKLAQKMAKIVHGYIHPSWMEKTLIAPSEFSSATVESLLEHAGFRLACLNLKNPAPTWWQFLPGKFLESQAGRSFIHWTDARRVARIGAVKNISITYAVTAAGFISLPFIQYCKSTRTRTAFAATWFTSLFTLHGAWVLHEKRKAINELDACIEQCAEAKVAAYKIREENNQQSRLDYVTKMVGVVALVAGAATAIAGFRALYVYWKKEKMREQGSLNPTSPEEILERDKEKTVWKVHEVSSISSDGRDPRTLIKKISNNIVRVKKKMGDDQEFTDGIFLSSNMLLVPYHLILPKTNKTLASSKPYASIQVEIVKAPLSGVGGPIYTATLDIAGSYRIPGHDLVLFHAPFGGSYADIRPLFREDIQYSGQYCSAYRDGYGNVIYGEGKTSPNSTRTILSGEPLQYQAYETVHCTPWKPGDCMTLILSNGNSPRIIGFHLMGNSTFAEQTGYSVATTRNMIDDACLNLSKCPAFYQVHGGGDLPVYVAGEPIGWSEEVNPRSPVNWMDTHAHYRVLGSCKGASHYKSMIRDSKISKFLLYEMGPQLWGKPKFKKEDGTEAWRPWSDGLLNFTQPCNIKSHTLLHRANQDYVSGLIPLVDVHMKAYPIRKMNDTEVLSGVDGVRFLDAMNMKTSIGFPQGGTKRNFIVDCPKSATHERPLQFKDPRFTLDALLAEKNYLAGKQNHFIFKACLKDEPTKLTKDKVRVFQCAPMTCQLLMRKYFLPIARMLSMSPLMSECAVGVNAFSPEWQEMHEHITHFGNDRIFAGDYKGWDTRLPPHLVLSAFDAMIQLAQATGNYTASDIKIMRGLAGDIAYPITAYNGTLLQFLGSNPSGQNLTAYINSICNSLLVRMFYFSLDHTKPFRDVIKIMTYGDDIIGSVHLTLRLFSIARYAKWLDDEIGMVFTMPDKTSELSDYLNIQQADFLKRRSRYSPELNCIVGILDLESVRKSLYCARCPKFEEDNVMESCITSALHEYFYHGRDIYDKYVTILKEASQQCGLSVPALSWKFEDLVIRWKETYEGKTRSEVLDYPQTDVWLASLPQEHLEVSVHSGTGTEIPWTKESHTQGKKKTKSNKTKKNKTPKGTRDQDTGIGAAMDSAQTTHFSFHSGIETAPDYNETQPLTSFVAKAGHEVHNPYVTDSTFYLTAAEDVNMSAFLARPILLQSYEWTPVTPFSEILDAWGLWLNNPRVINRICNYKYITGTMCLKFLVNGTPFHFGKMVAAINYWPPYDTPLNEAGTPYELEYIQLSVLPHISIDPSQGSAGCLEIPLINPWTLTKISAVEPIFNIILRDINSLNAATATPSPVTINVYAWMKDVTLSSPTAVESGLLVPQSGSEYGIGPVSQYASSVVSSMAPLTRMPVIAPYARATSVIASGIGAMAALLGFSRPNSLKEETPMQNKPFGNTSNYNYTDSSVKLALDAKNEVTVDPRVVGSLPLDEMNLVHICKKPALLQQLLIADDRPFGDVITRLCVRPTLSDTVSYAFGNVIFPTPMAHTAAVFKYWRGSIKVRIEIVASKMHKGKVRIVHDPAGSMLGYDNPAWAFENNLAKSYILDLDVERTYEMSIGWTQRTPYLRVPSIADVAYHSNPSSALPYDDRFDNGTIGVHIVTPITGPVSPTNVYMNVYVSAGDDFELAVVNDDLSGFGTGFLLDYQSGEELMPAQDILPTLDLAQGKVSETDGEKLTSIFFGERITSLRQILKRYNYVSSYLSNPLPANTYRGYWRLRNTDFPHYYGSDPNGINRTADTVPKIMNFGEPHNLLNWFTPAYLCRRGGLRHKYMFRTNSGAGVTVTRLSAERATGAGFSSASARHASSSLNSQTYFETVYAPAMMNGAALIVPGLNPVVEFETPYYSEKRFEFAQDRNINIAGSLGSVYPMTAHQINLGYNSTTSFVDTMYLAFDRYVAAAEDFSLSHYKYPPPISVYSYVAP